jgi:oxygen-independent coproporphyrinogen-3 oxidase
MNDTLVAYMTRAVPRYTSYPPVPHFAGIEASTYDRWLNALDPGEPVSLYLHVPFCRQLCWYCGCNMKLASRDAPLHEYARTLMNEVTLLAERMPARMTLSHLHWGGGTPTALAPNDLEAVMAVVHSRFDFTPDAEIAIESDPRTLSDSMIERVGALGFTRASFGVQEFDPKVQRAINRIQPPDMVTRAVDGLRDAGVAAINFDLIYGLPHQTIDTLTDTVATCATMRPDRLALFGYAHVPWMAKKQRLIQEAALPGMAERAAQADAAASALIAAGYKAIGLDHFALPEDDLSKAAEAGTLARNFQGYTTDTARTLLGVGASSIGRTPQGYVQNTTETGAWARAIEGGALPIAKGHALSGEDALRGQIIERLMCDGRVDLGDLCAQHGVAPEWAEQFDLSAYERDGLLHRNGARLDLTDTGRMLVRVIASEFDAYFSTGKARHSVAV